MMHPSLKPFTPLFKIAGMIGAMYLLAWGVETAVWPNHSAWIIYLTIGMAATFPLAYWQFKRRIPEKVVWPYFITMLDGLLPILPYFFVLFALIAPLPQMAAFTWGATTTGEVQSLATEQRIDFERAYHVTVIYFSEAGGQWTKNVTVGRSLFAELTEGDTVPIHYLPRWPDKGILADPYLMAVQARLLLWSVFVLTGWFVGAVVKHRERAQAAEAAAAPPTPRLQQFNLDTWLTTEDDHDLWQTVLTNHFPDPDDETVHLPGLRCGVGQAAPDARFKIQPTAATCFEWGMNGRIRPTPCPAELHTDADHDPVLAPLIPLQMITIQKLPRKNRPYHTILVERPSAHQERVLVYTAVYRKNGRGTGKTTYWERHPDGTWHDTGKRFNWWYEG